MYWQTSWNSTIGRGGSFRDRKPGSGAPAEIIRALTDVPDLVAAKSKIAVENVKVNDIWANDGLNHCGLVVKAEEDRAGVVQIQIRHDSSNQGGVFTNDFRGYFHGQGSFYR